MRFQLKDTNLFLVPGNSHMLHLATVTYGLREFIVMACIKGPKSGDCYIEEVVLESRNFDKDVWANCKFIADDNLAFDLAKFADERGITDMKKRFEELRATGNFHWLLGNKDLKTYSQK